MIKKMSSQDFNDILENTQNKIVTMNNNISSLKKDMELKLKIISYEMEYLNSNINKINNTEKKDDDYILLSNLNEGLYECFGTNIHAYFKTKPINLFNIIPINSLDIFYKDEAKVKINDVENDYFDNILKADNYKDKEIFFEELPYNESEDNNIKLTIYKNRQKQYGYSKFNIIEIDPYIIGSFDIEKILIYDLNDNNPSVTLTNIQAVNKTRILLDKKYDFNKIEIFIKPKFISTKNDEKIIPFGLKHIYLLEADFRNDSYIEIKYQTDSYIDYINNKVDIYTPEGIITTTLTEQGIKIYLDKIKDTLNNEQEPTNTISRNVNTLYFYIPLKQSDNTISSTNSIYAFKFYIEKR